MSDDLLWHYTDTPGFTGIAKTRELWATCTEFLNDTLELKLGLQIAKEELASQASFLRSEHPESSSEAVKNAASMLSLMEERIHEQAIGDVYVTSFSKDGDSLPQWRSYGQLGYAIGFDPDDFLDLARSSTDDEEKRQGLGVATWQEVRYSDDAREVIERIVKALSVEMSTGAPIAVTPEDADFKNAYRLATQFSSIKHRSFSAEAEARLVFSHGDLPHDFRSSPLSGPIPYLRIPFRRTAVRKITVAPGPNLETRLLAAEFVKGSQFHDGVEVSPSNSSYKG